MNRTSGAYLPQIGAKLGLHETPAVELPLTFDAIEICSVPLRFTEALVRRLLRSFAPNVDVEQFWQLLNEFGLAIQRDEDEWRLDRETRQYFLSKLEQENPTLAQQVHATVLKYLETTVHPTLDEDHVQLQRAYHTTPSDVGAGAKLYWSTYCRIRASNRFAMLPVLAHLAESQANWLTDHEQDIRLYRAAALYYAGPAESKQRAAELLGSILEQGAPVTFTVDASFLLGTLQEQTDRDEAARLYEQATELSDSLNLNGEDPDVQRHLRLTLAKSFFNLASILQTRDDAQELDKAEHYYRYGIQIVAAVEPGYEATQLRRLVGVLQKHGKEEEIEGRIQRISQIEDPFRRAFLGEAILESDNIGYLYYAISALNHGLGYERQLVRIEIEQNGAARLEGTYTLKALSTLSEIDTYLQTAPESDAGVHFEQVESLTPTFTLSFKSARNHGPERIFITIDPPPTPGDELTYRWTANASPGTFSTTPEQLAAAGFDSEHAAWEIIVPIRYLEIQVVIPCDQTQLPRVWFELWRIGTWHPAGRQAHTAYRAFLKDDPGRVQCDMKRVSPDSLQLDLKVGYPWMAMSYALSWEVL